MNERVPAQKGRKWCGMQPGTLWYAISLCSPVHDAIQVPRFYKDFCFLQSHKLLVLPVVENQNGSVFVTIFCILKSYLLFFFFIPRLWFICRQILLFSLLYILVIPEAFFTLSAYSVVGVNVVWVFGDIEASYKRWNITLKKNSCQSIPPLDKYDHLPQCT